MGVPPARRDPLPLDGVVRALILVENESVPHDRRVIEEARSLLANGYDVSVICPADPGELRHETLDGITVRRYRALPSRGGALSQVLEYANALVRTLWHMAALSLHGRFDVIQACNPPDLFFLIAWPFRLSGSRFIFDQHDLAPELYSALYGRDSGALMRALRWTERASYAASDAVIATNGSYKRLACSRGGVPPERVFVVRNGPRQGWPCAVAPDPSLKGGARFLVVYMGVMGYQDGVDVLLDVIATLAHGHGFADTRFALVGDGNASASLKERARELGIEPFVEFTGWIKDQETLSRYLVSADACVCPEPSSPLNDSSTFIKVMEYMASGTPVVAFDLPETRVSAGEAALYAPPGDVEEFARLLRGALEDGALRARMAAAAAERMPALRWEAQVPDLLAAYDCALSGRRGRS